jgi:hypothetical protein
VKALRYASWLTWHARWIWGWILPPIASVAAGIALPASKSAATILAALLQFAGLAIAFVGLAGDAKTFGKSLGEPFRAWWSQRPGKLRLLAATATVNIGSGSTGFAVSRARSTAQDVDGRLAWLEQRVYAIQEQADGTAQSLHKLGEETTRNLETERKQRAAGDQELRGKLAEHAAGGVHLNVVALWWVFVGTVLGLWVSLAT